MDFREFPQGLLQHPGLMRMTQPDGRVEFAALHAGGDEELPARVIEPVELYANGVTDGFTRIARMPQYLAHEEQDCLPFWHGGTAA